MMASRMQFYVQFSNFEMKGQSMIDLPRAKECDECTVDAKVGAYDHNNTFYCHNCWDIYLNNPSREEVEFGNNLVPLNASTLEENWKDCIPGVNPSIREDLKCPICWNPMGNPVILSCGHAFHQQCIQSLTQCPLDRVPISPSHPRQPSTWVKSLLGNIKCSCIFSKRKVSQHRCPERCPMPIADVLDHMAQCDYAPSNCKFCNQQYIAKEIEHHRKVCPSKLFTCGYPDCDFTASKDGIRIHYKTCENAILACFGHSAGCKKTVRRKDYFEHEGGCPYVTITKQQNRIEELTDEIKTLKMPSILPETSLPDANECGLPHPWTKRKVAVAYNEAPKNGISKADFLKKWKNEHSSTLTKSIVDQWVREYLGGSVSEYFVDENLGFYYCGCEGHERNHSRRER